jgi:uncharacterized membrane protein YphA (DoxX/SURF4 family)
MNVDAKAAQVLVDSDAKTAQVLSVMLALVYLIVGFAQIAGVAGVAESFAQWGYPAWFRIVIGVLELAGGGLLLVPKVSPLAAVGLMVLMVGAIYTHVVSGQYPMIMLNLVLIALLGWLGWLRRPAMN